jgi:hypothetical protein
MDPNAKLHRVLKVFENSFRIGSSLPTLEQIKDYCSCSSIEANRILRRRKAELKGTIIPFIYKEMY